MQSTLLRNRTLFNPMARRQPESSVACRLRHRFQEKHRYSSLMHHSYLVTVRLTDVV
jgi:hypothetical protein